MLLEISRLMVDFDTIKHNKNKRTKFKIKNYNKCSNKETEKLFSTHQLSIKSINKKLIFIFY